MKTSLRGRLPAAWGRRARLAQIWALSTYALELHKPCCLRVHRPPWVILRQDDPGSRGLRNDRAARAHIDLLLLAKNGRVEVGLRTGVDEECLGQKAMWRKWQCPSEECETCDCMHVVRVSASINIIVNMNSLSWSEFLQSLVGEIDAELFKRIELELLEPEDVEHSDESASLSLGKQGLIDASYKPAKYLSQRQRRADTGNAVSDDWATRLPLLMDTNCVRSSINCVRRSTNCVRRRTDD